MAKTLVHTSLFLVDLLLLASPALAQSQVAGDLSLAAPYGTPPALFNESIARTVKQSSVYIPGYNLSAPEGSGPSGNGSAVTGWQLGVAVSENVPLKQAMEPGVDKADVIDATTLWLRAPEGVNYINSTAWKVCATVFPFVNMSAVDSIPRSASPKDASSGDCGPWVTDQCAAALNEVGVVFGISEDGDCYDITVPPSCLPYFEQGKGNGTTIPLDGKTLDDGRFYAWGSVPTTEDNTATLTEALNHVWPVILTWVQFSPSGKVFSANTYISCVSADGNETRSTMEHDTAFSISISSSVSNWAPTKAAWIMSAVVSTVFIFML